MGGNRYLSRPGVNPEGEEKPHIRETDNYRYMGRQNEEYEFLLKLREQVIALHKVLCYMTAQIDDSIEEEIETYE